MRRNILVNAVMEGLRSLYSRYNSSKHSQAWADYGYKDTLTFDDHYQMYRRFGLAKAGIDMTINQCWSQPPSIHQAKDAVDAQDRHDRNEWEKKLDNIIDKHNLWKMLKAADKRQAIYQYGAVIVQVRGIGDQVDWGKPLGRITDGNIVRFIPVYQSQLDVSEYDTNQASERYGEPIMYNFQESNLNNDYEEQQRTRSVPVHHSRVIVFAEGADDGSIFGTPKNEAGFNDLITLEKIIGAGGEGFWKNASSKFALESGAKDEEPPSEEELEAMDEALQEFHKGFDKHLFAQKLKLNPLSVSLPDPKEFFNNALASYSASVETPNKILIGAQTGRLAADEDGKFWLSNCMSRSKDFCDQMVKQVIDWLIDHGVLNRKPYIVEWPDLLAPSDDDKVSIVEKMANVNQKVLALMGEPVFTATEMRQVAGYDPLDESDFGMPEDEDDENIGEGDDDSDAQEDTGQ